MATSQEIMKGIENRLIVVEQQVKAIPELKDKFDKYVTQERFRPVEYIVYGLAGGILLTVLTAVLAGVVFSKTPEPKVVYESPPAHQYVVPYASDAPRGNANASGK